jgi:hypothetical protein
MGCLNDMLTGGGDMRKLQVVLILSVILSGTLIAAAGESETPQPLPANIYLDLSEAFYSSLAASNANLKTLSTRHDEEYLRQIAVATRYIVETNLQLLRQQQRIIDLLQAQGGRPVP